MNDDDPTKGPEDAWPPPLDPALVENMLGTRLLVGLTYLEHNGDFVEQKQLHGVVEEISMEAGIVLRLPDGSTYRLPPDLRGVAEAPRGTYRLRSTGEEIEDPDFLYTWTITKAPPAAGS